MKVTLQTDIFGKYFVIDVEQGDNWDTKEFLLEEIRNVGYEDLFAFNKNIELEPNSTYECEWFIDSYKNWDGIEESSIPTISSVKKG